MNNILVTHFIMPSLLRADDFAKFFEDRKVALLRIVTQAMGKPAIESPEAVADDEIEDAEE
jgi:hypothetical protein